MLPFEVPLGTTLDSLFAEVFPKAHAQMVPPSAGNDRFVAVHEVTGFKTFTFEIRGQELRVREGDAENPHVWVVVEKSAADLFLTDWLGPKNLVPKNVPKDIVAITDPRIMKRLALVSAKAELALTDLDGARVTLTAAFGTAAKKHRDAHDPDVVLEASTRIFTRLLEGTLPPEEAIAEGHVTVRGKRLLAMQLAFALAPFYPKR